MQAVKPSTTMAIAMKDKCLIVVLCFNLESFVIVSKLLTFLPSHLLTFMNIETLSGWLAGETATIQRVPAIVI